MNIIVCIKQVSDPEAPPSSFKIDPATNKIVLPPGMPPVISFKNKRENGWKDNSTEPW